MKLLKFEKERVSHFYHLMVLKLSTSFETVVSTYYLVKNMLLRDQFLCFEFTNSKILV